MSLYMCKRSTITAYKASIRLGGTLVTLLHPTDTTKHINRLFNDNSMLVGPTGSLGWTEFITDFRPYIAANGSITITCKVSCRVDIESDGNTV